MYKINLVGKKFGRYHVDSYAGTNKRRQSLWNCTCECGNHVVVLGSSLRNGSTKSCGCLRRDNCRALRIHGQSVKGKQTPEYISWRSMIQRCTNPKTQDWKDYGGRGSKVCRRWIHSFPNFFADMGKKPTPQHSVDRWPNKDGNYRPSNCRWATWKEQNNNRRPFSRRRKQ